MDFGVPSVNLEMQQTYGIISKKFQHATITTAIKTVPKNPKLFLAKPIIYGNSPNSNHKLNFGLNGT